MSVWSSGYVVALGSLILIWAGVAAYVLITRALYDFRHLSFYGARRFVDARLARATTEEDRARRLRRLPRRTLAGIASDASVDAAVATTAARVLLERNYHRILRRASAHRTEADKWARIAALRIFSVADWSISIPLLADALRDPDEDVVAAAVTLLGARETDAATHLLVDALVDNSLARSRIATQLDGRPATQRLLLPLVDHDDEEVRYWAATLLRPVEGAYEAELALASLGGDPSPQVRVAVAKSFARVGGATAVAAAHAFLDDPVWFVRAQAARTLGRTRRPELADVLTPLLRDAQWWVRAAAKESLIELGEDVTPHVVHLLRDRDKFARNGAAEVLFEIGAVERWAGDAVAGPGQERALRMLRDTLLAGGAPVQRAAVERLEGGARREVERLLDDLPQTMTA